jgi:hypothetical protein
MKRQRFVLVAAVAIALSACGESRPPYAFDQFPEQRFSLTAHDSTTVDGEVVEIERLSHVRISLESEGGAEPQLAAYLERYYLSVRGAPGGDTEIAISRERGFASVSGESEVRLDPGDPTPTAPSVIALLKRPLGRAVLDARGRVVGPLWHSSETLFADIEILEWWLFAVPVLAGEAARDATAWNASREVPRIGRYRLGVELPLRYERVEPRSPERGAQSLQVAGLAERRSLSLADGFSGALKLVYNAEVDLGPSGAVRRVELELRVQFDAQNGTEIRSAHQLTLECVDCDQRIQIPR